MVVVVVFVASAYVETRAKPEQSNAATNEAHHHLNHYVILITVLVRSSSFSGRRVAVYVVG